MRRADGERGAGMTRMQGGAYRKIGERGGNRFAELLAERRLIASVKEPKQIEQAIARRGSLSGVFLLTGHIGTAKGYVDEFHRHGLPVFLHLEKIGGISTDVYGLDYIAKSIKPTGVITTKTSVVRTASRLGLVTVQRFFLVDSDGLANIAKSLEAAEPDVIELMPARMPELIGRVRTMTDRPIIAGGFVCEPNHVADCLSGGAAAVSTSRCALWDSAAAASADAAAGRRIV